MKFIFLTCVICTLNITINGKKHVIKYPEFITDELQENDKLLFEYIDSKQYKQMQVNINSVKKHKVALKNSKAEFVLYFN